MFATTGADELAETRAFNAELETALAGTPGIHETDDPEAGRAARREGRGVFPAPVLLPEGRDRVVAGVGVRVFTPPAVEGAFLHIHGGGWTLGTADEQDPLLWDLARKSGVAVVSVGYRLAPEHPYPAGPDDCERVARWLVEHARSEFGTDRLVIGGESAGAHLSAVTLLRLRDRHHITGAFRGAVFTFGCFDLSGTPSERRFGDRNLVLSTPIAEWFLDQFLPGRDAEERRDPEVSPLYADLSGMPPARFVVGTLDPLVDDTLFMAARWQAAGNAAELEVVAEAVHGFTAFPIGVGRTELARQQAFVSERVRG